MRRKSRVGSNGDVYEARDIGESRGVSPLFSLTAVFKSQQAKTTESVYPEM